MTYFLPALALIFQVRLADSRFPIRFSMISTILRNAEIISLSPLKPTSCRSSRSLRNACIEVGEMREICQIKSNQIKSLLLSHHHSTSALVSEILTSVLQTVQENNHLHMDSTYLQTVQKTMCKIHIHILSTHSVL